MIEYKNFRIGKIVDKSNSTYSFRPPMPSTWTEYMKCREEQLKNHIDPLEERFKIKKSKIELFFEKIDRLIFK